jgi:hypothetical protein
LEPSGYADEDNAMQKQKNIRQIVLRDFVRIKKLQAAIRISKKASRDYKVAPDKLSSW